MCQMTKITAPLLMFSVLLVSSPPEPGTRVISQVHDDPPLLLQCARTRVIRHQVTDGLT